MKVDGGVGNVKAQSVKRYISEVVILLLVDSADTEVGFRTVCEQRLQWRQSAQGSFQISPRNILHKPIDSFIFSPQPSLTLLPVSCKHKILDLNAAQLRNKVIQFSFNYDVFFGLRVQNYFPHYKRLRGNCLLTAKCYCAHDRRVAVHLSGDIGRADQPSY